MITDKENGAFAISLRAAGCDGDTLREFGRVLKACGRSSIDTFLDTRREFLEVGKACIARALLPFEAELQLSPGRPGAWYHYLFDKLYTSSADEFAQNKLTIITFNFDRAFERALFLSLMANYRLQKSRYVELARSIEVLHVHGQLGEPSWLNGGPAARPYGLVDGPHVEENHIRISAAQIRIVHEEVDSDVLAQALVQLQAAEVICSLGFGYQSE